MVVPPQSRELMTDKAELRRQLRRERRDHVARIPDAVRGLQFPHPPAAILDKIPSGAVIGLYHAGHDEAPTTGYVGYFCEHRHMVALPRFANRDVRMQFVEHVDPLSENGLERGPFGVLQPTAEAEALIPDVFFVPLIGFTATGERLGQGGGHYDRYSAEHPGRIVIGLAWDIQCCEMLPIEAHDQRMNAVITPTRIYGPF